MGSFNQRYDWKRFWCPREGRLWVDAEGYLLDPDGETTWYAKGDTVPFPVAFEAIKAKPCLLLLGEPGIGKTDAMEVERDNAAASLPPGEVLLAIDCRIDRDLKADLFDNPKFMGWLEGKHTLHLFIDSLDEHPDVDAASQIVGKLRRGPIERLRLCIACRTAEVPLVLEPRLDQLWGKDAAGKSCVAVYELAPLRKRDVALAAHTAGLDADAFLSEVAGRGATALAIKPVTLEFLLRRFRAQGALPKTRWEIYELGCHILCDEPSLSRRDHEDTGSLDKTSRMVVASRIAAACVLGNRSRIFLDSDPGDLPQDALLAERLKGMSERAGEEMIRVDAAAVQETLKMTQLFTERGQSRLLGWAHQTYAEFLTARFLCERGFRLEDLADILYPSGGHVQIVPALREVAAWMASVDVDMFRKLVKDDPRTLLQSDVAMVDDVEREKLVAALLERFTNRSLIDLDVGGELVYRRLWHPGLKEQLEPWIRGKENDWMARRAAIDIAEACRVHALQDALADVALDPADDVNTRVQAAQAVTKIGDDQTRLRLLPLAQGQAGSDPNDELKGYALTALWPKQMAAKDMFQCLARSPNIGHLGAYFLFVDRTLKSWTAFSNPELVEGLRWAALRPAIDPIEPFADLIEHLMRRAWERGDDPAILDALVRLASVRLPRNEDLFLHARVTPEERQQTTGNIVARRERFIERFLQLAAPLKNEPWRFEMQGLLSANDIPWMVQKLDALENSSVRQRWVQLIDHALGHWVPSFDAIDAIADAMPRHAELREAFRRLEPIELGSEREAELRKEHAKYQEQVAEIARRRAARQERLVDPPPAVRVLRCLERFEQGDMNAFWQMQKEMSLRPTSIGYEDHRFTDLTKSPGWQDADQGIRERILAAAKHYIMTHDPKPEKWLGKRVYYWPAIGGYRGLFLLWTLATGWVEALPSPVWQRWAPVALGYPPEFHEHPTTELHRQLVGLTYRHAPNETLAALDVLFDEESRRGNEVFVTRELAHCWDARLGSFLFMKVQDSGLKPEVFGSLLGDLLHHHVAAAREYAASLLTLPLPKKGKARKRARLAAQELFRQVEDAGWPILEPVFRDDPVFGYKVVLGAASRMDTRRDSRWQGLSENQLADLFLWMEEQFPHEGDRNRFTGKMQTVTSRDSAAEVRNALLTVVTQRGTKASVEALRRIEQALPGQDWIKFMRIRAEEQTLAGARRLLSPEEVIALRPRAMTGPSAHNTRTMNEGTTNTKRLVERCDVLLMTVTEVETRAVLDAARVTTGRGPILRFGTRTYRDFGEIGGARVLLVSTVQAGSETPGGSMSTAYNAISEVAPQAIIMVGIAFGVDPEKQPIGQVLYSLQLQPYGPTRMGTDKDTGALHITPRGDRATATPWLLDRFHAAKQYWNQGGSVGCDACLLLSGPSLIDNIDYRDTLRTLFPEAKGGEMEGAGLYGAAMEKKVDWVVVKAICDYADGNKHEKKSERQALAAERAASFVFHALGLGAFAPREN
ncbi:5'-methylthioadenosine/S-adenosylhomocysteine nucleosidase family protein [Polyangium jinanense]|uniref:Nucleoside phosphorylase domain-containing protein n=1 Tax=Polyangium jinanense TaxID=2829994 RepID=A0A9X3X8Y9_9BACT|nr:hypothetical protein [Polyangium jinanense]MDC3985934.1 hypothetical protein [Polyangium jinanense]